MTREDLFLAIGSVEESRLERSELEVTASEAKPGKTGRIFRNFLIAAILVSMLAVTAYAVAGYLIFESPQAMITAIFGDKTGYDHKGVTTWTDPEKPGSLYENPGFDRVPVDEALAETEVAPMVSPVGQSISWNGYTLRVDANLYDPATKCGVLTYTLENPEGIGGYETEENGKVWFTGFAPVSFNQYGYDYVIEDQCTKTKFAAAYYYQLRYADNTDFVIEFTEGATVTKEEYEQLLAEKKEEIRSTVPEEEAIALKQQQLGDQWQWYLDTYTREEIIESGYTDMAYEEMEDIEICPDKIVIPEKSLGEMSNISLANGDITISPIAMYLDMTDWSDYPESYNAVCIIRFADGTEYVVRDETHENYMFAVGNGERNDVNYMFNRIIDVNEITAVVLDGGMEIPVT